MQKPSENAKTKNANSPPYREGCFGGVKNITPPGLPHPLPLPVNQRTNSGNATQVRAPGQRPHRPQATGHRPGHGGGKAEGKWIIEDIIQDIIGNNRENAD